MSENEIEFQESDWKAHTPLMETTAASIIKYLSELDLNEIAERIGISVSLAKKVKNQIYDFPLKSKGNKALDAFTGEVFKALDVKSLDEKERLFAETNVRIISSLYGLLNPTDIIKSYRLDFNKNCGPEDTNLIKYLKPKLTIEFVKYIKANTIKEIIDLLPGDASKCLDWKIIRAYAKVIKIDFKEFSSHGLKTPSASKLKNLRGKLLREIIERKIENSENLKSIDSEHFIYSPEHSGKGLYVFLC